MNRFKESLKEFSKLRTVAFTGLMAALAIVLNYVTTINIGPTVKIGFSGLPNQAVAVLFGPAIGGIFGGVLDVLKWFLRPDGSFFPGFTVSAIAGGVIYGIFLYKKPHTLLRVFLSQLTVKVFVNLFLNTLWLILLYNKAASAILPARLLSNAVMLPIDTAIMYFMVKALDRTIVPMLKKQ